MAIFARFLFPGFPALFPFDHHMVKLAAEYRSQFGGHDLFDLVEPGPAGGVKQDEVSTLEAWRDLEQV